MSRDQQRGAGLGPGSQIGFNQCGERKIPRSQEGLKARRVEKPQNV